MEGFIMRVNPINVVILPKKCQPLTKKKIRQGKIVVFKRGIKSDLKTFKIISCFFCGKELQAGEITIDHLTALCRGGSNKASNKVAACYRCNQDKAGKSLEAWYRKHPNDILNGYKYVQELTGVTIDG